MNGLLFLAGVPAKHRDAIGHIDRAFAASGAAINLAVASIAALAMAITASREYHAPLLAASGIGMFWGALVLAIDRYLVMTLSTADSGRLAQGFSIAARVGIAVLISAQIAEQIVLFRYADRLTGIREEQKMLALSGAAEGNGRASGLDAAKLDHDQLKEEAADLRTQLTQQRPPELAALLDRATALEAAYAAQAAQVVASTRLLSSQMSQAELAAREARQNANWLAANGEDAQLERYRAAAADRNRSSAAQTLAQQDLALAEARRNAERARADFDKAIDDHATPLRNRLAEVNDLLKTGNDRLAAAEERFAELQRTSDEQISRAWGVNSLSEIQALALLKQAAPEVAISHRSLQALVLLIELLPLLLKILSLRSVLGSLVHAERAEIEAAARARRLEAEKSIAIGEIEKEAELTNYQRLAIEDPVFLESTREKVRAMVARQIIDAKLDANRAERAARIKDLTAESDTVLELFRQFRRQRSEVADDPADSQLAEALTEAQREDLRHLQDSRKKARATGDVP